jgi:hypothetical protein
MAHGDKKWIVAYDGKLKRSNNRTKLDYSRDLKWWHENDSLEKPTDKRKVKLRRWQSLQKYCPQCQHVKKPIRDEVRERTARYEQIKADYIRLHAEPQGEFLWHKPYGWDGFKYDYVYIDTATGTIVKEQKTKVNSVFFSDFQKTHPLYDGTRRPWQYDTRSYLCYKCERKYEVKQDVMYTRRNHGDKAHYQWSIRQDYREYRTEVKQIMRRARHDDELYDHIPRHKRGWYD